MRSGKASALQGLLTTDGLHYCILHGWDGLPEYIPSDLDIVVAPQDLRELEESYLKADGAMLVQMLQHEATCYYFVLAFNKGASVDWLPVDAATDYRRDGRVWFMAEELLRGRRQWKEFWVASPEVEFQYLLVKKILKADVPEHTRQRLQELVAELGVRADGFTKGLLGEQWGREISAWIRSGDWNEFERNFKRLKRLLLWQRFKQDPLNPLHYWLPEILRTWRRWRYPTGLCMVVLGPDGAGKSTLIKNLEEQLKGLFRQTAVFHLKPGLLGRRGNGKPVTDPHGKSPRSLLASLAKNCLYLLNYTMGSWLKVRPQLVRSTLVLFDRYYYDLLVDPKRYRYGAPLWIARLVGCFIPRPDLVILLDATLEALHERKQEVPPEETKRQRDAYLKLVQSLPNGHVVDASKPQQEVVSQVGDIVLDYMAERTARRLGLERK